jgi:hypothetical protein
MMHIQGISIENRALGSKTLSKELAYHILERYNCGKIAVATDRPLAHNVKTLSNPYLYQYTITMTSSTGKG